jgi:branched-chain amino acid transport system ATP-binding protein
MTVRENVQMALMSHHNQTWNLWARAADQHVARADELLDLVGMVDQADRAAAILAYGDLKRLELAIALAHDPNLLLMDEPTAGMAPKERVRLMAADCRYRGVPAASRFCSPSMTWTLSSPMPTASWC